MTSKKIEPTGVMVDEAANVLRLDATHASLRFQAGMPESTYRKEARTVMRAALRAALNHPDAAELLASEWKANAEAAAERAERAEDKLADPRPWEPLAPGDPLHAGDEVRREWRGVSTRGIVYVQRFDSQVYTAERGHLGHQGIGTWYVRRAVQDLPTASCAVIVPADEGGRVEAMANVAWYANEAVLGPDNRWHGVWRAESGLAISSVRPEDITPGTWKVAPNA